LTAQAPPAAPACPARRAAQALLAAPPAPGLDRFIDLLGGALVPHDGAGHDSAPGSVCSRGRAVRCAGRLTAKGATWLQPDGIP